MKTIELEGLISLQVGDVMADYTNEIFFGADASCDTDILVLKNFATRMWEYSFKGMVGEDWIEF